MVGRGRSAQQTKPQDPRYWYWYCIQLLTCRPSLCSALLSDQPLVSIRMGQTLNPDEIKEGDDVYFECDVKANPKVYRLVWYHDVSTAYLTDIWVL